MNRRVLLAIVGGLLLPVPLVAVFVSVMLTHPQGQTWEGRPVSPMLTAEERLRLQTYHRQCLRKPDCEPPLGCLFDPRAGWFYCADSQCVTDEQCPEGFACHPLPTVEEGPLVRYCIPPGVRKEGENCVSVPSGPEYGCEPGLLCGQGWCGRPCQLDKPLSCPQGFFCGDTTPGPTCLPSCEGRACPDGMRCIRDGRKGASACAVVYGQDCQQTPCTEGRECVPVFGARKAGQVWMKCSPECGPGLPVCPEGLVCERRSCLKPCDPSGPNVCAPGFSCQSLSDERQQGMCRSDM
jgi:hypothetical protein